MSARDAIFAALRRASRPLASDTGLPAFETRWSSLDAAARVAAFESALCAAGGVMIEGTALVTCLDRIPDYRAARCIAVAPPLAAAFAADPRLVAPCCAHDAVDVDLAIVVAEFGVAENGAVLVSSRRLHPAPRSLLVLPRHLVVVLARDAIVGDMHEAMTRLAGFDCEYMTFLAGPSKTADIEQALVLGAHGATALTVLRVGGGS
jgi:L-lactate dehydrogenase complex protein LldG